MSNQSQPRPICQPETPNDAKELIRLGCCILRVILAVLQHQAAQSIGRRVALLANATLIPESNIMSNARGCAAAMDMTEGSFKQLATRRGIPAAKPGDEKLYRLSDLVKGGAE